MRNEDSPVGRYRKDPGAERFIAHLNATLRSAHDAELADLPPGEPLIHVIGVPRSGTTLAMQLLSCAYDIGYIDNLAATFWQAPLYGIRLSRKLLGRRCSSFNSDFGRTAGLHEPHEFGYFWTERLRYAELAPPAPGHSESIDWDSLAKVLRAMAADFGAPVMFKNFLAMWHLQDFADRMPESRFLFVRRDLADAACSLLRMRERFMGDRAAWVSMKPREYGALASATPVEQVAGQAFFLDRALAEGMASLPPDRYAVIDYADMVGDPGRLFAACEPLLGDSAGRLRRPEIVLEGFARAGGPPDPERAAVVEALGRLRASNGTAR
ncbi:MAG TPA: sulfotransferase [Holophagaceae bacterium]|nr:sulfotransferase [Holophagaceae bacterium]